MGEYTVNIRSEICIPDDHTGLTCTIMAVEYDFLVIMEPCIVNSYSDTLQVGNISYNIGAPSLINVGQYIFDEDPICNYPETVTITGLPEFIDHNESTSDFTLIINSNLDLIGEYTATIKSEI